MPLFKIVTPVHFLGFSIFQPFNSSLPWLLHVLFQVSSFSVFIPSLFAFLFIFLFLYLPCFLELVQLLFYLFIFYFIYSLIDFYLTNNAKALLSFSLTHFLSLYNLEAFSLSKQQGPPPPPPPISVFHTERDTMCEISFWFMNFFSLLHNSKHLLLVFDIFHSFLSHIFFSSFNLLFFGL